MRTLFSLLAFVLGLIIVFAGPLNAEENASVTILDGEGRTQSLVETKADSLGTVKVLVQDLAGDPLQGAALSLIDVHQKKAFASATTRARGVASFFQVPPGTYAIHFDCTEFDFSKIELRGITKSAASETNSALLTADKINVIDSSGRTRAFGELPVGSRGELLVQVTSSSNDNDLSDLKVRLVEITEEAELEVLQEQKTDKTGKIIFRNLPGGEYKLEIGECSSCYTLGGVGLFDYPLSGIVCPPGLALSKAAGNTTPQLNKAFGITDESKEPSTSGEMAQISVVDREGKTLSLVDTKAKSLGSVKVFVQDEEGEAREDVNVSLVTFEAKQLHDTAKTHERGIASFFDVPTGTYSVEFSCDEYELNTVQLIGTTSKATDEGLSAAKLNILDQNGSSRAYGELPVGVRAQVKVSVKGPEDLGVAKLKVRLVEIKGDNELEVIDEQSSDNTGSVRFNDIPASEYKIEIAECPSHFKAAGVGMFDYPMSAVVCAPAALLSGASGSAGAGAGATAAAASATQLGQSFGIASATSAGAGAAGVTTGAAVTGGLVVGGAVTGGIVAIDNNSGSSGGGTPPIEPTPPPIPTVDPPIDPPIDPPEPPIEPPPPELPEPPLPEPPRPITPS